MYYLIIHFYFIYYFFLQKQASIYRAVSQSWQENKMRSVFYVHACYGSYTLKNKAASQRCHRRSFFSKWFHKEPLTSFCFFVAKEGSSDYKKVKRRCFFKELVLCGTKNGSSMASLEAPLFLRMHCELYFS